MEISINHEFKSDNFRFSYNEYIYIWHIIIETYERSKD